MSGEPFVAQAYGIGGSCLLLERDSRVSPLFGENGVAKRRVDAPKVEAAP